MVNLSDTAMPSPEHQLLESLQRRDGHCVFVGISEAFLMFLMTHGWDLIDVAYDCSTIPPTPHYTMRKKAEGQADISLWKACRTIALNLDTWLTLGNETATAADIQEIYDQLQAALDNEAELRALA